MIMQLAQLFKGGALEKVATPAGVAKGDIYAIVGQIINIALGLVGFVLLGYLLLAGYLWMTAGGEDKQVQRAKDMIKNAVIGLVIIVAAFVVSFFIMGALSKVGGTTPAAP
jgi:cytochrome bd-type quinol oxidase subunit 2